MLRYWFGSYKTVCPDEYIDMGNIVVSHRFDRNSPSNDKIKCVPKDCVEPINNDGMVYGNMAGDGNLLLIIIGKMLNQVAEMDIIFLELIIADNLFIKLKINVLLNHHLHHLHLLKKLNLNLVI